MGNSFLDRGDKYKRLNDTDIEVAVLILDEVATSRSLLNDKTESIIGKWREDLKKSYPGVTGIDLNLLTEDECTSMATLLQKVSNLLPREYESIPADMLNRKIRLEEGINRDIYLSDYNVDRVIKTMLEIRYLLI